MHDITVLLAAAGAWLLFLWLIDIMFPDAQPLMPRPSRTVPILKLPAGGFTQFEYARARQAMHEIASGRPGMLNYLILTEGYTVEALDMYDPLPAEVGSLIGIDGLPDA